MNYCLLFSLVDYSLRIRSIQVSDGGDYTCYISTNGPPVSVTHNLQILGDKPILGFNKYSNTLIEHFFYFFPPSPEMNGTHFPLSPYFFLTRSLGT
jgi:hypothetical protein